MNKVELFNDHFQNFKVYGIPKAQLIIADPPYNLGKNAYASNPSWYVDGDNKNGESDKAGKEFFDTDKDFRPAEFMHFCSQMLVKEPKESGKAPCMIVFCEFEQQFKYIELGKQYGFNHYINLVFRKNFSAQVFKESVRHDTDWMMKTFTFNENMMIAFVPLVISHLAWMYADKVMKYCAEHKISETVKLSRAVKHVRQEYVDSLKKDLDARHIQRIEKQTEEFFKEYTSDFTIFWYCVNSQYKKQFPGDIYKDMKTDAFLGVLMCRFLVDHNKRMDKIIESKMGFAQSIKNPYMDKLETCLDAYCGNQVIECDTNIKACLKVLEKNINEIDFEITG